MKQPKNIGVREAAQRLGVSLKYIYDLLYAERLPGQKVGRIWLIPVESIEARLKQRKRPVDPCL
jgi:excisionase family DNA binding protein